VRAYIREVEVRCGASGGRSFAGISEVVKVVAVPYEIVFEKTVPYEIVFEKTDPTSRKETKNDVSNRMYIDPIRVKNERTGCATSDTTQKM
jgi:hypothetical protein